MGVDFRIFSGHVHPIILDGKLVLSHSAKGSSWEDHKYIKRIDGTYYYPNNYENGRHIEDAPESEKEEKINLDKDDIEKLANEVIKGNFGNGERRKELLGENYEEIQKRVNELIKNSSIGSKKVSEISSKSDKVTKALENIGNMGYNVASISEKYNKNK